MQEPQIGNASWSPSASDALPRSSNLFDNVPDVLKQRDNWLCWKSEERGKNKTKVPYNARTGRRADVTKPVSWSSFDVACAAAPGYDGIGYVFDGTGIVGIDLDKVIDENGKLSPEAEDIVKRLSSYTEVTPSGTGLHILVFADADFDRNRRGFIEIYKNARYFTVTGNIWGGRAEISLRNEEINGVYKDYLAVDNSETATEQWQSDAQPGDTAQSWMDDDKDDLAYLAIGLEKDDLLRRYYNGDRPSGDESADDSGFITKLAYWCNLNVALIRSTFLESPYFQQKDEEHKEKWTKRNDYAERTIKFVVNSTPTTARAEDSRWKSARYVGNGQDVVTNDNTPTQGHGFEEFTDVGDALRVYRLHGEDIRFMPSIDAYVLWTNGKWEIQPNLTKVVPFALSLAADVRAERDALEARLDMANMSEPEKKKWEKIDEAYEKHAKKVQGYSTLRNIISILKSDKRIEIQQDALDADPWLLNCRNGTLDLRTGEFREHKKSDYITKMVSTEYDQDAQCPLWESTLKRFLPDASVRDYFQKAVGYSLTGDMRERCLDICHGTGKNGKSTIVDTIRKIMGEYGAQADKWVFFDRGNDGDATNGLARLRGCRFVAAPETKEGARLSVDLIKQITGGEAVACRFLFQEYFEYQPAMKIWITTNHRPRITDTNKAIWDRVRLIPFNVTIPDDEVDDTMAQKLTAEYPGILNWMIEGCLKWQEEGLEPPMVVADAIREYRESEDPVRMFLNERCDLVTFGEIKAAEFFNGYKAWCDNNGVKHLSNKYFSQRVLEIEDSGIVRKENRFGSFEYHGVQWRDGDPDDQDYGLYGSDGRRYYN